MRQDSAGLAEPYEPPSQDEKADRDAKHYSLFDDAAALFEHGKTYARAEVSYQKSRAGFIANRLKVVGLYGAAAFACLHLALIAFAVGLVIALAPLIGPWLATLAVVLAMALGGIALLYKVKSVIANIRAAFENHNP